MIKFITVHVVHTHTHTRTWSQIQFPCRQRPWNEDGKKRWINALRKTRRWRNKDLSPSTTNSKTILFSICTQTWIFYSSTNFHYFFHSHQIHSGVCVCVRVFASCSFHTYAINIPHYCPHIEECVCACVPLFMFIYLRQRGEKKLLAYKCALSPAVRFTFSHSSSKWWVLHHWEWNAECLLRTLFQIDCVHILPLDCIHLYGACCAVGYCTVQHQLSYILWPWVNGNERYEQAHTHTHILRMIWLISTNSIACNTSRAFPPRTAIHYECNFHSSQSLHIQKVCVSLSVSLHHLWHVCACMCLRISPCHTPKMTTNFRSEFHLNGKSFTPHGYKYINRSRSRVVLFVNNDQRCQYFCRGIAIPQNDRFGYQILKKKYEGNHAATKHFVIFFCNGVAPLERFGEMLCWYFHLRTNMLRW